MIDPEPSVAGIGVSEIVPERVNPPLVRRKRSQRVGPTLRRVGGRLLELPGETTSRRAIALAGPCL
jgi:hypothetical protein